MTGIDRLEWYVILPRDRDNDNPFYNIFNSNRFRGALMDLKARSKKDPCMSLEDGIRHALQYSFWGRCEYEIDINALFSKEIHKIDVYTQVMLHQVQFYKYVLDNWNHIPAKSYKQQMRED